MEGESTLRRLDGTHHLAEHGAGSVPTITAKEEELTGQKAVFVNTGSTVLWRPLVVVDFKMLGCPQ
jgi:hypothetical protein